MALNALNGCLDQFGGRNLLAGHQISEAQPVIV